ncbi:MAG: hypothetical protein ACK59Y_11145 [Betaproteobacteria bacterium]|jgi:hypothetical protein|nr:hypothetical protein [Betaproteobacteria bacterium]
MFLDAELHLAYKVGNAQINLFPYPHFYLENVFPDSFYAELRRNLPDPAVMIPIEKARNVTGYKERFVLDMSQKSLSTLPDGKKAFWTEMHNWLVVKGNFGSLLSQKFRPFIEQRFAGRENMEFYSESLLVEDITNYKLGPHTDSPRKVITVLFYLPPDLSQAHMGTSIYLPKDPSFTCAGGPHYPHEGFMRLHTNPFVPNSMFVFLKTENSFHGVEPVVDADTRRWLLLYDIFVREQPKPQIMMNADIQVKPKVKFSF